MVDEKTVLGREVRKQLEDVVQGLLNRRYTIIVDRRGLDAFFNEIRGSETQRKVAKLVKEESLIKAKIGALAARRNEVFNELDMLGYRYHGDRLQAFPRNNQEQETLRLRLADVENEVTTCIIEAAALESSGRVIEAVQKLRGLTIALHKRFPRQD